jgi:hypothetical protein
MYFYSFVFLLLCVLLLCTFYYYVMCSFVGKVFLLLCMFRSVYSVSLCCSVYCLCVNVFCTAVTGISGHFSPTLTKVFSVLFLSCKANARV